MTDFGLFSSCSLTYDNSPAFRSLLFACLRPSAQSHPDCDPPCGQTDQDSGRPHQLCRNDQNDPDLFKSLKDYRWIGSYRSLPSHAQSRGRQYKSVPSGSCGTKACQTRPPQIWIPQNHSPTSKGGLILVPLGTVPCLIISTPGPDLPIWALYPRPDHSAHPARSVDHPRSAGRGPRPIPVRPP